MVMAVGLGLIIMLDERSSMYLTHAPYLQLDTDGVPQRGADHLSAHCQRRRRGVILATSHRPAGGYADKRYGHELHDLWIVSVG
jgi:hypothetical protein